MKCTNLLDNLEFPVQLRATQAVPSARVLDLGIFGAIGAALQDDHADIWVFRESASNYQAGGATTNDQVVCA